MMRRKKKTAAFSVGLLWFPPREHSGPPPAGMMRTGILLDYCASVTSLRANEAKTT